MLSPLDDLPIHQVAQPVRQPGTSDRNFYDRYYFNCHPCSDELFLIMGMGQYPNLGVQDAFALVRRGDEHRVVRASRELGLDRLDTSVGPFRVEVIEGLKTLRCTLDAPEHGLSLRPHVDGLRAGVPGAAPRRPQRQRPRLPRRLPAGPARLVVRVRSRSTASATTSRPTTGGGAATARGGSARSASRRRPATWPPSRPSRSAGSTPRSAWRTTPWSSSARSAATAAASSRRPCASGPTAASTTSAVPSTTSSGTPPVPACSASSRRARSASATSRSTVEPVLPVHIGVGTGYGFDGDGWKHGAYQGDLEVQGKVWDLVDRRGPRRHVRHRRRRRPVRVATARPAGASSSGCTSSERHARGYGERARSRRAQRRGRTAMPGTRSSRQLTPTSRPASARSRHDHWSGTRQRLRTSRRPRALDGCAVDGPRVARGLRT